MNAPKNALKSMLCCASLSLVAASMNATAMGNGGSSAVIQPTTLSTPQSAFSKSMQAQMGDSFSKFQMVDPAKVLANRYIITFKEGAVTSMANTMAGGSLASMDARTAADFRARAVSEMTDTMASVYGARVSNTYGHTLGGFAASLKEGALVAMIKDGRVAAIEQDQTMSIGAFQQNATWGLDRIDQASLPLDGIYEFNFDGTGVDSYIVDTGIRATHNNFGGRVTTGFTSINDGRGSTDCNGHGTHVAGTVGSSTWGVAKNTTLVPVRVLGCNGSGSNSGVIAGVDYVARVASGPSVANMSLGGGASNATDNAVRAAVSSGVTFVVAAGNSTADACGASPARAGLNNPTITVGSTTNRDARSGFSNFGRCVDIFAPGSSITSTWSTSNTATNTISGTSMASPHVAGVAALYLDQFGNSSPAAVEAAIKAAGVTGRLSGIRSGSPNLLLQSLFGNGGGGDGGGGDGGGGDGGGTCAYEENFSSGAAGWTIDGSSTCTTGTYVRGNPTQQSNGGVVTQVGGDDGGDGGAVFTARNTSAGADDVDGGTCVARSGSISVDSASTLSFAWFHGQRDTGDDASDGFAVEYSTNGGSSFQSAVSIGDQRSQAQWRDASVSIPAGANVVIRVSTTDGAGAGDLVEGGIDSIKICPN